MEDVAYIVVFLITSALLLFAIKGLDRVFEKFENNHLKSKKDKYEDRIP